MPFKIKKSSNFVYRKIADESIIIPIKNDSADLASIYTLNETADFVWNKLDENGSVEGIINSLIKKFNVSHDEASCDLMALIGELEKAGLIEILK